MPASISHRAVVERVSPRPGEPADQALWRAVQSFGEPKPRILAEYSRMLGFLHEAFGQLDIVVDEAELRARLSDVLRRRTDYFRRPRRRREAVGA